MKKKHFLVILILSAVLISTIFPISAYAKQKKYSQTERRHLIEYTELSMKRYMEFEDKYNKDYGLTVSSPFVPFTQTRDEYEFETTFGNVSVEKSSFTVTSVIMTMSSESANSKNEQYMFQCISAMSALEYDEIDESNIELEYKIYKTGPSSAFEKALKTWSDDIQPAIKKAIQDNSCYDDDPILVYSGNYDYYFSSMVFGGKTSNFIIAKSR